MLPRLVFENQRMSLVDRYPVERLPNRDIRPRQMLTTEFFDFPQKTLKLTILLHYSADGINPECMTDDGENCFSGTTRNECETHITDRWRWEGGGTWIEQILSQLDLRGI